MNVDVDQPVEDYGEPQAAVVHLLHDHMEDHAEEVNEEQSAEDYGDL